MKKLIIAFTFGAIITASVIGAKNGGVSPPTQPIVVGQQLPREISDALKNNGIHARDYVGRGMIIHVWSTWHPYCFEQLNALKRIYSAQKQNIIVIGIHRTDTERQIRAEAFARDWSLGFPFIPDPQGKVYKTLSGGNDQMPISVYIDKAGIVRVIQTGRVLEREIQETVDKLVI